MKKYIKPIISIVAAVLAMTAVRDLAKLYNQADYVGIGNFAYNIYSLIIGAVNGWLVWRLLNRSDKRLHVTGAIIGTVLASLMVFGGFIYKFNDIFIDTKGALLVTDIIFLMCLTIPASEEVLLLLDKLSLKVSPQANANFKVNFFVVWAIIFVAYVPYFLSQWPGNFVYDASYQLNNVNSGYLSTHHPLLHTLLMGWPYKLGISWGNPALGFQIYTLVQMASLSAAFAYAVWYLARQSFSKAIVIGIAAWFALFPMNALFAITATKDVFFAAAFIAFIIYLLRGFKDNENFKWPSYIALVLMGTLSALFRNNAKYALAVGMIFIFFFIKGKKKKIELALTLLGILVLSFGINKGLERMTNALTDDNYKESLSMPLQCMARVASYKGDELSKDLYDEICLYIPEEALVYYSPFNADPIKGGANETLLKTNTLNFVKLWAKIGLKFPGEYTESILSNTYGYWKLGEKMQGIETGLMISHLLIGNGPEIEKKDLCPIVTKLINPLFFEGKWNETPVISVLMRSDTYVWILLFTCMYAIYKKKKGSAVALFVPVMYIGTCLLGPLASLRYIYGVVAILPVVMLTCLNKTEN